MTSKPSEVIDVAAPSRPHWSDDRDRIRLYAGAGLLCVLGVIVFWCKQHFFTENPTIGPFGLDFLPFWGASHFVLQGHPLDAYNIEIMNQAQIAAEPWTTKLGGYMPWLYPPIMMVFLAPVALLPFMFAYTVYASIGFALFYATLRRTAPWADARLPIIGFPGVLVVVVAGQIALYTTAIAGISLVLLRKRPVWAGIFAGLLFIKPHIALLFPLAFLCARQWRALAACIVTVIVTTLLAAAVFGIDAYTAFLHANEYARQGVANGTAQVARIPTFFITARMFGAPVLVALVIHGVIALGAVAVVIDFWRRPGPFALRAATLICATTLVSPYLYDYDLALLALVIAWYVRDGVARGWLRGEREWLVVLWITPLFGLFIVLFTNVQFMPLITLATLGMLWRRRRKLAHVPDLPDAFDRRIDTADRRAPGMAHVFTR
ncbi:glycosyltransferase family 87 protein [Pandoraea norimbergensis]|uniref:DUF2029 domain-containing protein n=1 Tax=Pandoraea norimbergensis TaxID=93219 RepID=A0ABM5WG51_9BURK|nr:glycosyltransferase family 87 protein [Pandoraea norimbergensis]ALS59302.1 hypothetical protein AT302_05545 [Pandoraea norimbergensis]